MLSSNVPDQFADTMLKSLLSSLTVELRHQTQCSLTSSRTSRRHLAPRPQAGAGFLKKSWPTSFDVCACSNVGQPQPDPLAALFFSVCDLQFETLKQKERGTRNGYEASKGDIGPLIEALKGPNRDAKGL